MKKGRVEIEGSGEGDRCGFSGLTGFLADGGCHDGTACSPGAEAALGREEKLPGSGRKIGVRVEVWAEDREKREGRVRLRRWWGESELVQTVGKLNGASFPSSRHMAAFSLQSLEELLSYYFQ